MEPTIKQTLAGKLLGMADDELILGHRDSEWTGHAPILEEDIALANIAQDEIGHAVIWYSLAAELLDEDPETYPDRQVFFRDPADYRNVQMVELPNGDWAFSLVRQVFFDAFELVQLEALAGSAYPPLAKAAAKIRKEEVYHTRHSRAWVQRLGLGTGESNRRMQVAVSELWPYALQLFVAGPKEKPLVQAGLVPDSAELRRAWDHRVFDLLRESRLGIPSQVTAVARRRSEHTEHLTALLAEMQEVARRDPAAHW